MPPTLADLRVVRRAIPTNRKAFALCEKEKMKKKKNKNKKKNSHSPRMLLLAESSFAINVQQDKRSSLRETSILVAARTYHKAQVLPPASADLHVVRRAIRTNQNAFSLCESRKK
jgi:hypothetical protein